VCGVVGVTICLVALIELRVVTDGHTDGQTDRWTHGHSTYCTSIASRGESEWSGVSL